MLKHHQSSKGILKVVGALWHDSSHQLQLSVLTSSQVVGGSDGSMVTRSLYYVFIHKLDGRTGPRAETGLTCSSPWRQREAVPSFSDFNRQPQGETGVQKQYGEENISTENISTEEKFRLCHALLRIKLVLFSNITHMQITVKK